MNFSPFYYENSLTTPLLAPGDRMNEELIGVEYPPSIILGC